MEVFGVGFTRLAGKVGEIVVMDPETGAEDLEQAESPEWVTACAGLLAWQKLETICPSLDGPKTYLKNQTVRLGLLQIICGGSILYFQKDLIPIYIHMVLY